MPKKLDDFILYKDIRFYSAFPSIAKLDNGELLLVFRRARDVRHLIDFGDTDDEELRKIKLQMDHIDGRSQLVSIKLDQNLSPINSIMQLSSDPEAADQDASLLVLQNKNILLSSFSWYPVPARLAPFLIKNGTKVYGSPTGSGCHYILWGGFTRISENNGDSWSKHNYLPALPTIKDIIPGKRNSHGGPIGRQAIEINDEILLPVYHYMEETKTDACHLYVSKDNGNNWMYRSTIASDYKQTLYFQEPCLIECQNGNIMAFMRTANADDRLYTVVSDNQGKTWKNPVRREKIIGHPIHPIKLKDGRIFICYGYRHKPYGIRGQLLDGNGEELIGEEIIIRDDALCTDIGYPCSVQLDNSDILVIYYFTDTDGIRHIAGSLLSLT